jgi:hypothetical protein
MNSENPDSEDALNRLLDDEDFHFLDSKLGRFNIFESMGGVRGELRHSNFLGYLLSPSRPHGFSGMVLERVLREILNGMPRARRPIRPLELAIADLDDATVHRERDNIDLLIEISSLNLVVLIENKIGAGAGDGQLNRYKEILEGRFPSHRRLLVFLTPDGVAPECDDYVAFSYQRLAALLDELAQQPSLAHEPALILSHYVEMLRRHVVPNEELKTLALRLYERHQEAFDFVFETRPQPRGILDALKSRVLGVEGLIEDRSIATNFRFVPSKWDETFAKCRCAPTLWTKTGRGLIFEIKVNPTTSRVHVTLVMGPLEAGLRGRIYGAAIGKPRVFKGIVKPMGQQYSTLFNRELLTPAQAENLDFEQQCLAASMAWSDFQGQELMTLMDEVEMIVAEATAD